MLEMGDVQRTDLGTSACPRNFGVDRVIDCPAANTLPWRGGDDSAVTLLVQGGDTHYFRDILHHLRRVGGLDSQSGITGKSCVSLRQRVR